MRSRIDKNNKGIVHGDPLDGTRLRVEHMQLHNTKITSNDINEKKTFAKSRNRNKPFGRIVGIPQMIHQLLGDSEIETNLEFEEVSTLPFEFRSRSKVQLDKKGSVKKQKRLDNLPDAVSPVTDSFSLRPIVGMPTERQFTENQRLLVQCCDRNSLHHDKISLFGLRPPELRELVPRLGYYYEWFVTSDDVLDRDDIIAGLDPDIRKCKWIDALGREVWMRKCALPRIREHLQNIDTSQLQHHSMSLRNYLLHVIETNEEGIPCQFIRDDGRKDYPIVVYSKVVPEQQMKFVLHLLLVLGEYNTELDLKNAVSMREAFARAKLIPFNLPDDAGILEKCSIQLIRRVINEIIPYQPITMRRLDSFIIKAKSIIDSVLIDNCIPMTEMPPCLSTELYDNKKAEVDQEWKKWTKSQLRSMLDPIKDIEGVPTEITILNATKTEPYEWNPLDVFSKSDCQSQDSYDEQQFAMEIGKRAVDHYCAAFLKKRVTKGVLNNGAPGAGKTFVLQCMGLYAMSQGLKVMTSSLMAIRSSDLGGIYLHQLFKFPVNRSVNLFRYAEVCASTVLHFH